MKKTEKLGLWLPEDVDPLDVSKLSENFATIANVVGSSVGPSNITCLRFTSSGTFRVPNNAAGNIFSVVCVGGGGNGGNVISGTGGGGGGSGYIEAGAFTLTPGSDVQVVVGDAGGSTSFGEHLTALPGENGEDAISTRGGDGGSGESGGGGGVTLNNNGVSGNGGNGRIYGGGGGAAGYLLSSTNLTIAGSGGNGGTFGGGGGAGKGRISSGAAGHGGTHGGNGGEIDKGGNSAPPLKNATGVIPLLSAETIMDAAGGAGGIVKPSSSTDQKTGSGGAGGGGYNGAGGNSIKNCGAVLVGAVMLDLADPPVVTEVVLVGAVTMVKAATVL